MQSDPTLSIVTLPKEDGQSIDLDALGYGFAMQKLDPRVGSIKVNHVEWPRGKS